MLYIAVYLLNLADLIITHYVVNVYRVAIEANLLMAPLLESWAIVFIKVIVAGCAVCLLYRKRQYRLARGGAIFLLVLYSLVVLNNGLILISYLGR